MVRLPSPPGKASEFFAAAKKGALLGSAVLMMILPPIGATSLDGAARQGSAVKPAAVGTQGLSSPIRRAAFGTESPTDAVRHVANWSVHSGDHQDMAIVVVDKKDARVWIFSPAGELRGQAPVLLGSAVGDHSVPGIGDKPLSQVRPNEKTTPAGRFIAEPGTNTHGEDIVWVDYDAAVSMHRVRANVQSERRLQRLASPTPDDNRISFGCINLPVAFYDNVLHPTVQQWGAVIYVLPETQSARQLFGSYDVPAASARLAQR